MNCGKVFKKVYNENFIFQLVAYNYENDNYSELIKNQKNDGFRQVLFNSELMLRIVKSIYDYEYLYLSQVKMSIDTDESIQEEISNLALESRSKREMLFKIADALEWYSDKESIDICEIHFYNKKTSKRSILKNNGIILGNDIHQLFEQFLSLQLERYFDEE